MIRPTRYLSRLLGYARAGNLSELFVSNIGAAINQQCDRAVADADPVQCHATGRKSTPA